MADEEQLRRGRRLRQAAKAAGFTSQRLGDVIGKEGGTVRGYWRGYSDPDVDTLVRYARACGVSVDYLATGEDKPMGPSGPLMEWVLRVHDLKRQGLTTEEAIERVSGPKPTGMEGWDLTDQERELLYGPPDQVNAAVDEQSGGDWARLPRDRQRLVLQLIAALAPPKGEDGGTTPRG